MNEATPGAAAAETKMQDSFHLSALQTEAKSLQPLLDAPTLEDAYAEGRRDEQEELSSVLPGTTYMDPPDGGAPTILEQLQRQAKDAARYLWLRERGVAYCGDPERHLERGLVLRFTNLDSRVDAALGNRTPVRQEERPDGNEHACRKCRQTNIGQSGEYPCSVCGLPTTWDESFVSGGLPAEGFAMMQAVSGESASAPLPVQGQEPWDEALHGYTMSNGVKAYCCYGMYCDIGHSSTCKHAALRASSAPTTKQGD